VVRRELSAVPLREPATLPLLPAGNGLRPGVDLFDGSALVDVAVTGFLRVVTHPRIFDPPTEMSLALAAVDGLLSAGCLWVASSERHWSILKGRLVSATARGNLVGDAHLAAVSIEHGATLVSADRDFARFPGLS
jgi:toxin-antitoxin system PIN domain toxin